MTRLLSTCSLLLGSAVFAFMPCRAGLAQPVTVGTTFSQVQCEYLGLDWKQSYRETLSAGFTVIRLGAYWERIEKREGVYDFSELDWQIQKAAEKNIAVILTVGMKAPRWPEFFIPGWVREKIYLKFGSNVAANGYLAERTLSFITAVVSRYRENPAIRYWQVENEPLDRSGAKNWWIGKRFLRQEIDLTRRLDRLARPVIINIATYPNIVVRFFATLNIPNKPVKEAIELCDILAVNVYPVVGRRVFRMNLCFWTRPERRRNYLDKIVDRARADGKPTWATELQAEPWEPGQLVHVSQDLPVTCMPESFLRSFNELQALGVETILLWGVEYWYFRFVRHGDRNWWKQGKELISLGKETTPAP